MNPSDQPSADVELTDGKVRLRTWQDGDAIALSEAARESVATVGRWLPWCRADHSATDAMAWVAHCSARWSAGEQFSFAVFDLKTGELVGGVGLNQRNLEHRSANLGYWIRQSRQREGLLLRAATLVARFGFTRLGLIRIEIIVLPDNLPSRAAASKLGAHFEAIARQRLWVEGAGFDAAVYGLIPSDLDPVDPDQPAEHIRTRSS